MLGQGIALCDGAVRNELEAVLQRLAEVGSDDQVALLLDRAPPG